MKEPIRMCLSCRTRKPKEHFIKIVKSLTGEISIDLSKKSPGRGAYICKTFECFNKAKKSRGLERTFKCKIEECVYNRVEDLIAST